MEKPIDTARFSHGRSVYQLDHMHQSGKHFISITQTTTIKGEEVKHHVHIAAAVIQDLTELLTMFSKNIPKAQLEGTDRISNAVRLKMKEAYLKGVPIEDLVIRFNQPIEIIQKVLMAEGLAIVDGMERKPYGKYGKLWRGQ